MAVVKCPLYNNPYYSYSIDLSGAEYNLTFRYSSRSEGYLMDISDAEETFIIRGIQLVPLFDLLGQYSLVSPEGTFILLPIEEASFSNSSIPNPRRLDLTHQLIYLDSEGLETIQGV